MKDQFQREIDYIRISITDRCNLRCRYCMPPGGVESVGHERILRFDEILRLMDFFAKSGFRKVKITGGEPLVRKGAVGLVREIKAIPGIEQVTVTTNGILLKEKLPELADAGIDGINVSLDTLNREKYRILTGTDGLEQVLKVLEACMEYPQIHTKINAVTLADYNREEIADLAALAKERNLDVRFIEMMPVGYGKNYPGYPQEEIMEVLQRTYGPAEPYQGKRCGNGPAAYYTFDGFQGRIGMIGAMSHTFCSECNRVRLTSEGFLKPCLQYAGGTDLRQLLREGADEETMLSAIRNGIYHKPCSHSFLEEAEGKESSGMSFIGG